MKLIMEKYHGAGNDYLIYDPNKNSLSLNPKQIQLICNRNFGIGSDGILVGPIRKDSQIFVTIYNPDGSETEKSGNGICIFSKYLLDAGYIQKKQFTLMTKGGSVEIYYLNEEGSRISINIGKLTYWSDEIPVAGNRREVFNEEMIFHKKPYFVTCASIGNPHCVIPVDTISKELACSLGPYVESAKYFPNRINMQLLKVLDKNNIQIEVYERGAGYTLASGTSSCVAAGVAHKLGLTANHVMVHMPGGKSQVTIQDNKDLILTSEVELIGEFCLSYEFLQKLNTLC